MDDDAHAQFLNLVGHEFMAMTKASLDRRLAEHGVENLKDADSALLERLFREASFETAARAPTADLALLDRVLSTVFRADFSGALNRTLALVKQPYESLGPAVGKDPALLMAFFGVPVAPMDYKTAAMMGEPSTDLDQVSSMFDRAKSAWVGYSTCEANFYVVLTDCQDSLARVLHTDAQFGRIRALFERDASPLPDRSHVPFQRACGIFRRYPGEQIGSLNYIDPSPDRGSILFHAGWVEDGQPKGSINGGYKFVPLQLVDTMLKMPDAHSFVRGDKKPAAATRH